MKKNNLKNTLFRLLKFLDLYKGRIILVIILNIIATLASVIGPLFAGKAVDDYIAKMDLDG